MADAGVAHPAPLPRAERVEALDMARGAAVLGVLLMNVWAFAGPQAFFDYPLAIADRAGAPVATWAVVHTLFEGSQRTLLSLLFGAGALLVLQRLERSAPAAARGTYYRRTFALIAFGLVNAYVFMWPADILFVYGLAGLCLYPLRRLPTPALLAIVAVALAIPAGMRAGELAELRAWRAGHATATAARDAGVPLTESQVADTTAWERARAKAQPSAADPEVAADIAAMQSGSLAQVAARQAKVSIILQTIVAAKWWFLDALAMMVLGMVLARAGLLTRPQPPRRLLAVAGAAFAVGLPLAAWQTGSLLGSGFDPVEVEAAKLGYDLRRLAMGAGWLALLLAFAWSGVLAGARRALAAAGRMALTNYLAQSVLCALVFYGFGLGLYGRVTGFWLYGIVAAIWALELAWSGWVARALPFRPRGVAVAHARLRARAAVAAHDDACPDVRPARAPAGRTPMPRLAIRWLPAGLLAALLAPTAAVADVPLQTRAEASGYTQTSTHADVMAFVRELQRASPRVRVETLATSAEGRAIPLLVIGAPPPSSPADLRRDARAVVYLQANIHGGEVEGKEAFLALARELATGPEARWLDRLVVLIAPLFNPDGNERIATSNRPRQAGPAGGVGVRVNGQNLDLNRDGVKLETPEVRGLVERVLNRWDPVFFLDSHTHNGSWHQEPVTWTWGLNPNGDAAIFDYMAGKVWPAIESTMRERYATAVIPHGDFLDPRDPARGWVPLGPEPRYLSNYVGLRNRLAVLDEQYPYVDFATRVKGAHDLARAFLDYLHRHRDEVVALEVSPGSTPARLELALVLAQLGDLSARFGGPPSRDLHAQALARLEEAFATNPAVRDVPAVRELAERLAAAVARGGGPAL